jgi:signal transduction histidine kinase
MAREVQNAQNRIREMERQHIGRYLVHQIRNSVTPIRLCAAYLKDSTALAAEKAPAAYQKQSESIDIIGSEADKIDRLLARFRRLYAFPEPVTVKLELNGLVRSVMQRYPEVDVSYSREKVYIRGDKNLLEQALSNIVDNAVEAVNDRGEADTMKVEQGTSVPPDVLPVSVAVSQEAEVVVSDRGPGIPKELLDRLFQDYVSTKSHGMGIGLSFVKRVLDLHSFRVDVESVEGKGTAFRIEMHE